MQTFTRKNPLLLIGAILIISFSIVAIANAQEAATSSATGTRDRQANLEERREQIETRQEERADLIEQRQATATERIEQRQELQEERQAALEGVRQQRILNLSANISNRMEAAIERLFNIIERFEQRIEKLKQAGADTTLAETKLREAAQLLAEARAKLSNIDTLVYNATTSTEPKTDWKSVRETYLEAGRLIRASHQALRETISLLKTAVTDADLRRNAAVTEDTSTTSTETQ